MASILHTRRARMLVLACLTVVATGTLASYLARRQAPRDDIVRRHTPVAQEVGQQMQRFSLSKTLADQTVYTIQAEHVTNYEETGKTRLTGVTVLIYGKDGTRRDTLSTRECIYDPAIGSLWVPGEVEMLFDVALGRDSAAADAAEKSRGTAPGTPNNSAAIAVVASQLSFQQSTGIASTEAPVRFKLEQGEGSAVGATYDPKQQHLLLHSDVRLTLRGSAGPEQGKTHIEAQRASFAREAQEGSPARQRVLLGGPVVMTQSGRRVQGGSGEILLDETSRPREAWLEGDVVATQRSADFSGEVVGGRAEFRFSERGRVIALNITGDLRQAVRWNMQSGAANRLQEREGEARHVALTFSDANGRLERVIADEAVRAAFRSTSASSIDAADTRTITGERAVIIMRGDGKQPQRAEVTTAARLVIEPGTAAGERRTVAARKFDVAFDPQGDISSFRAEGDVKMQSQDSGRMLQESNSDSLDADFSPQTGTLERVRQSGRFHYRDAERQASAADAAYRLSQRNILLTGKPAVWNDEGRLTATEISLNTATNALTARGNVSSTFFTKKNAGAASSEPLHVTSDRLEHDANMKRSRYEGRARLWQGEGFLVEAASLEWFPAEGNLIARDKVYSVFRQATASANGRTPGSAPQAAQPATIRSNLLRFERSRWLAHYEDNVVMQSGAGRMTAAMLDIFLQPSGSREGAADLALNAGRIQRAVAEGDVNLAQGQRVATGDRADYLTAQNEVHLFGAPASVTDPVKGRVEGSKLTYLLHDDSIRVEGKPGLPTDTRWLVP